MTIYSRTIRGHAAALNADSALPRKLRTLLIAIDGKTTTDTYVNTLSAFGDVEALLQSLFEAGFIELQGGAARNVPTLTRLADRPVDRPIDRPAQARAAAAAPTASHGPDTQPSAAPPTWPDSLPAWERSMAEPLPQQPSRFSPPSAPSVYETGVYPGAGRQRPWQPADTQTYGGPAPARGGMPAPYRSAASASSGAPNGAASTDGARQLVPTTAHHQLQQAIAAMSDFVSTHLPLESIEILLELERLSSVEQLMGSLKGYESLIAGIGEPARKHLAALRNTLSSQA
jgi:hypothetical protein